MLFKREKRRKTVIDRKFFYTKSLLMEWTLQLV